MRVRIYELSGSGMIELGELDIPKNELPRVGEGINFQGTYEYSRKIIGLSRHYDSVGKLNSVRIIVD